MAYTDEEHDRVVFAMQESHSRSLDWYLSRIQFLQEQNSYLVNKLAKARGQDQPGEPSAEVKEILRKIWNE